MAWLETVVRSGMRKIRGKDVAISPKITASAALRNMAHKGVLPLLRGMLVKPFLRSSRGSFFLGRGVSLINKGHLSIGSGVYIGNYSYVDCLSEGGVTLGDRVTIREGCWLQLTSSYARPGTSITVGNQVYMGPRMNLGAAAPIVIGDRCQFGANVSLIAENHEFEGEGEIFEKGVTRKGIVIGQDVWVGNNVVILDGITIGDGAVIGAGTIVTKSIAARAVVVGNPGRVLRER